jgi:hypothetical protein
MKRNLLVIALLATSLLANVGCTKSAKKSDTGPTPLTGDWKVTYYFDQGQLRTEDYTDYTFDFKPKNAITATVNDQTSFGYWAISTREATQKLNIGFNTGDDKLSELTDDWDVIFVSETKVELSDNDASGSHIVHFTRQ